MTEGAYTISKEKNADGLYEIEFVEKVTEISGLDAVVRGNRVIGLYGVPEGCVKINRRETEAYKHSVSEYVVYTNTGFLSSTITSQLTDEDQEIVSKVLTNVREFGAKKCAILYPRKERST